MSRTPQRRASHAVRRHAAVFALICAAAAPAAAGPVAIEVFARTVDVASRGLSGESEYDRAETTDTGPFDATVSADTSGGDVVSRARASVESTLGPGGFTAAGSLAYDLLDTGDLAFLTDASGSVTLYARFTFDEPYQYTAALDVDVLTDDPGVDAGVQKDFYTYDDDGNPVYLPLPDPGETTAATRIDPGTYDLYFTRAVAGYAVDGEPRSYAEEFDFELRFAPVDGNGGEPNPIPLPPAAWSGLIVLGGAAILARVRKLFA
jgi:hypothetical protein